MGSALAGRPFPRVSGGRFRHQGPAARPQHSTETPGGSAQVSGSGPVGGRAPPRPRRPRAARARPGGGRGGCREACSENHSARPGRTSGGETSRVRGRRSLGDRDAPRASASAYFAASGSACGDALPGGSALGCTRLPRTFRSVSHASCAGDRDVSSPQRTLRAQSVLFLCVFRFSVSQRVLLLWAT